MHFIALQYTKQNIVLDITGLQTGLHSTHLYSVLDLQPCVLQVTLAYGCSDCCGEEASMSSGTRVASQKRDQKTKNISTKIDIVFCADGEKTTTACLFIVFDKERRAHEEVILHGLGACPSGFNPVVIAILSVCGQ